MKKILNTIFSTNLDINFIKSTNLKKCINNYSWQIIQIVTDYEWKKNHLLYATQFTPLNFSNEYRKILNRNKKILIFGDWRKNARYYRFLKFHDYDVYLIKINKKAD